MEIMISKREGMVPVNVMQIKGALDSSTYEQFISEAQALFDSGARDLLIDMTHLTFLSSAGIAALHRISRVFRVEKSSVTDESWSAMRVVSDPKHAGFSFQKHVKLLNPSEAIEDVLDTVGFKSYFEIFTDEQTAINAFQ
jgi:anti-anti-sigma regulatory factor